MIRPANQISRRRLLRIGGIGAVGGTTPGLLDLPELLASHPVVTIVAHWRGSSLGADDLITEPAHFLERVKSKVDPLGVELAHRLICARSDGILSQPDAALRASLLTEWINEAVIHSHALLPGAFKAEANITTVIDDLTLQARHRAMLDRAFPDLLRPGNQIELRDGLHAPEDLEAAVPEGWTGILDLAICHSAYAAHIVKAGRCERRIVANARKIIPGVRLRIQKTLYRNLHATPGNYATELMNLFRGLQDLRRK